MTGKTGMSGGPRSMVWLLTTRCNLSCQHCYAARFADRGELDAGQTMGIVQDAARCGVKHISFTGGEVFLRPDALPLIEYAGQAGISTSLVTNGSLMTRGLAGELARLNVFVSLSIDGAIESTHQRVRGKETWELVMTAARALREAGARFSTVMAVSRLNQQEVRDYLHLARELGARAGSLIPVMPSGRAPLDMILSPGEMLTVLREANRTAEELDFPVSLWCTPFARLFAESPRVSAGFCRTASQDVDVDPAGNVLLCDVLDDTFGNVTRYGVLNAWKELEADPLVKSVTSPRLREPCITCPIRSKCLGGCFARARLMTGDIHAPDPLCPRVGKVA